AGFDDQSVAEGFLAYLGGQLSIPAGEPLHETTSLGVQQRPVIVVGDALKTGAQLTYLDLQFLLEIVVRPVMSECSGGCDEGMVVAAEGTVVLAGFPGVVLWLDQGQGKGQAIAAQ